MLLQACRPSTTSTTVPLTTTPPPALGTSTLAPMVTRAMAGELLVTTSLTLCLWCVRMEDHQAPVGHPRYLGFYFKGPFRCLLFPHKGSCPLKTFPGDWLLLWWYDDHGVTGKCLQISFHRWSNGNSRAHEAVLICLNINNSKPQMIL